MQDLIRYLRIKIESIDFRYVQYKYWLQQERAIKIKIKRKENSNFHIIA